MKDFESYWMFSSSGSDPAPPDPVFLDAENAEILKEIDNGKTELLKAAGLLLCSQV